MAIKYMKEDDRCSVCRGPAHVRKYKLCSLHYRRFLREHRLTKSRKVNDPSQSLGALYPEVSREWNYERNGSIAPYDVYPNADELFWWTCPCDHTYDMTVHNRIAGRGCPYCSGNRLTDENSLLSKFPEIAAEWDMEKNGDLTPDKVHAVKKMKVWWKCSPKGHSYPASIDNRTNRKSNCPYCAGRLVCFDNCLATVLPDLAKEWHPTKNGELTPFQVTPGKALRVWWLCRTTREHEWITSLNNRSKNKTNCPYCAGKKKWHPGQSQETIDWKLHYNEWFDEMSHRELQHLNASSHNDG
ncbi:zinc-ribbon domain-containing protein [Neobacillus pocheonensis]|uniref:zinc-ribbon domain-containing protein n=1 Tax=Neobacillus pocheonensis TaxID=363869 RepID=UPI003D2D723A